MGHELMPKNVEGPRSQAAQGSTEVLCRWFELMHRRLAEGGGEEDLTGVIDLLVRR